jgi:hypothetical protein
MLLVYSSLLLLLGDGVAARLREANFVVTFKPGTNASLVPLTIDQHHIRDVDGGLLLGDAALDVPLGVRLYMLLDHHDVLDQESVPVSDDAKYAAALALVFASDNFYGVVALNLDPCHDASFLGDLSEPESALKLDGQSLVWQQLTISKNF